MRNVLFFRHLNNKICSHLFHFTATDAKNRWRNLRDRYVREKKMLLTEGEEVYRRHEVWPYLEDMSFLWDLIVHRK